MMIAQDKQMFRKARRAYDRSHRRSSATRSRQIVPVRQEYWRNYLLKCCKRGWPLVLKTIIRLNPRFANDPELIKRCFRAACRHNHTDIAKQLYRLSEHRAECDHILMRHALRCVVTEPMLIWLLQIRHRKLDRCDREHVFRYAYRCDYVMVLEHGLTVGMTSPRDLTRIISTVAQPPSPRMKDYLIQRCGIAHSVSQADQPEPTPATYACQAVC